MASDLSVVNAARVSFARRKEEMDDSDAGLIRFLMRDRHGCYDDATDVLTADGWKPVAFVTGDELFATRSREGRLVYQPALRIVRKEFRGHMIGFKGHEHRHAGHSRPPCSRFVDDDARAGRSEPRFSLVARILGPMACASARHDRRMDRRRRPNSLTFDDMSFPLLPVLRAGRAVRRRRPPRPVEPDHLSVPKGA